MKDSIVYFCFQDNFQDKLILKISISYFGVWGKGLDKR